MYCILLFYFCTNLKNFRASTFTVSQPRPTDLEAASEKPLPPLPPILDLASPAIVSAQTTNEDQIQKRLKEEALKLLLYRILFTVLAMPFAVARLGQLVGDDWSFLAIDVGACFYCSLGWGNVVVYVATRKGLISWDWLLRKNKCEVQPVTHLPTNSHQSRFTPPPTRRSTIVLSEGSVISVSAFHQSRESCIIAPSPESDSDCESFDWAEFIQDDKRTSDGRTIVVKRLRDSCIITPSPDSDTESFDWAEFIDEDKMSEGDIILERSSRRSGSEESLWFGQGTVNVMSPEKDLQRGEDLC